MTVRHLVVVGLSGLLCVTLNPRVHATQDHDKHDDAPVGLLKAVREATEQFRDVRAAIAANYASLGSCVSGPERGAMGIHYGNGALIMDGVIDAKTPELLIYEQRGGRLRFVGVEFLVLADAWNASHPDGDAAGADGPAFPVRRHAESLPPAGLLRAARLGVAGQSVWDVRRLESRCVMRGIQPGRLHALRTTSERRAGTSVRSWTCGWPPGAGQFTEDFRDADALDGPIRCLVPVGATPGLGNHARRKARAHPRQELLKHDPRMQRLAGG